MQHNRPRRIPPQECARLQGFTNYFVVNPSGAFVYKQLGSSVSVPIIEAVISDFIKQYRHQQNWKFVPTQYQRV